MKGLTIGGILAGVAAALIVNVAWPHDAVPTRGQDAEQRSRSSTTTEARRPPESNGTVDTGVCDRVVAFAGQDLPRVDQSMIDDPLGAPATAVVHKKSAGHAGDDQPNTIRVLDGACEIEPLFVISRGDTRYQALFVGQLILISAPGQPDRVTYVITHRNEDVDLG